MMQKPSDEALIAYLDGELDAAASTEVAAAIARDPALAREAQMLAETSAALRAALDDVPHAPASLRRGPTAGRPCARFRRTGCTSRCPSACSRRRAASSARTKSCDFR